jgi:hypothetical protein
MVTLEQAIENANEAKEQGMLNRFPQSCIILAETIKTKDMVISDLLNKILFLNLDLECALYVASNP